MAKSLQDWINHDVGPFSDRSTSWLSQFHFFRDPHRAAFVDSETFFAPADGVIVYQQVVEADQSIVDVKGVSYDLRQALRMPSFSRQCLVIGIFMTFFDVHVNRIPYAGRLSYRRLAALDTHNWPMLDVEDEILDLLRVDLSRSDYLHRNQRVVNRIVSPALGQEYYLLQIADHAVDCILPFATEQNIARRQGMRFSQIRFGSQVDLIVPLSDHLTFTPMQRITDHVEAAVDPLIRIGRRTQTGGTS